jgi:hypothetical protein
MVGSGRSWSEGIEMSTVTPPRDVVLERLRRVAIELARSFARKDSMEVIVHGRDGSVQKRETAPR